MKVSLIITIVGLLTLAINHSALASFSYDPQEIQAKVIDEAIRQNISPSLALAIAKVESDFNPQALSHAGAKGVMQIMPRTAEQGFGVNRQRLFDPAVNIEIGIKFIKQLLERYDGRLDIALSHYNGGSAVKDRFGKLSVIPATQQYVEKVMSAQQSFLKHDALLQNTGRYGSLDNKPQTILASNSNPTPTTTTHSARAKNGISNNHHWQNPQIATLRALRIHNITRNYKNAPLTTKSLVDKSAADPNVSMITSGDSTATVTLATPSRLQTDGPKPARFPQSKAIATSIQARIAKVRQWESIYSD